MILWNRIFVELRLAFIQPTGRTEIPNHTDQYLQWDNHHHLSAKYRVINTLTHRPKTVCNKPELLQKEMDHLRKALSYCRYPKWAMDRVERRFSQLISEGSNNANTHDAAGIKSTSTEAKTKGNIAIPYNQGLCKSIKKIYSKYGIQTHFKCNSTIKISWFPPGIRTHWKQKWGHLMVPMWRPCMG